MEIVYVVADHLLKGLMACGAGIAAVSLFGIASVFYDDWK